jgi:hypothetical protein
MDQTETKDPIESEMRIRNRTERSQGFYGCLKELQMEILHLFGHAEEWTYTENLERV